MKTEKLNYNAKLYGKSGSIQEFEFHAENAELAHAHANHCLNATDNAVKIEFVRKGAIRIKQIKKQPK